MGIKVYLRMALLYLVCFSSSFSCCKLGYYWINFGFGEVDFILYKKIKLIEINLFRYPPKVLLNIYQIILSYHDIHGQVS